MSNNQVETATTQPETPSIKQQALQSPPVVLSIVLVSSGVFVVLLAYGISILSTVNY